MNETVKILAILPAIIPSTTILVVDPLIYLLDSGKIELRVRLEKFDTHLSDIEWADLVIFCRNVEPIGGILERILATDKPYIYELDDNFFELPLDTPEGKYYRDPNRLSMLEKYIKYASLVRVYSPPLEDRIRQYTSKVISVKAPVNLNHLPSTPPQRDPRKIKIVFSTSRTVADNLAQIFMADLIRIIHEYGNNVEVHFWGYMPAELKGVRSVKLHRFMSNYPKYLRTIYEMGYDIGLAPLKDDLFHNSKTNNKFREYGACWTAGIYSNVDVYKSCVEDGKTGLLVSTEKGAWYEAIKKLINDPARRKRIQEEARILVEWEYAMDTFALLLLDDINRVLAIHLDRNKAKKYSDQNKIVVNDRASISRNLIQLIEVLLYGAQKVLRSIQNNGLRLSIRLALEQFERYVRYFELSRKINQRQKHNGEAQKNQPNSFM